MTDPPARHDLLGGASAAASAVLFGTIIIWAVNLVIDALFRSRDESSPAAVVV